MDLSTEGCYFATPEPFAGGVEVTIRITTEKELFQCAAVVAHATHGIGMGLRFQTAEPEFRRVLEAWLDAARAGSAVGQET